MRTRHLRLALIMKFAKHFAVDRLIFHNMQHLTEEALRVGLFRQNFIVNLWCVVPEVLAHILMDDDGPAGPGGVLRMTAVSTGASNRLLHHPFRQ